MTAPDREAFLNEVREAITANIWAQLGTKPDRYAEWIDTTELAQAAIDAMVRHLGPEF
ncbi:hypothetical protein [Mycolicibacterium fortuitum]|uniref:hypothetical protein n=1 Tax=Mycolicibacterium fortuitum TaxID=1766 RepID=UPI000A7B7EFA|nr:hypothetical protein [Mycolicibacterium fortuitum]